MLTGNRNPLKKHLASCKDVAYLASDYLDKNVSNKLHWKIRLHLLACSCCRRFVRHLKITQQIAPQLIKKSEQEVNAKVILQATKSRANTARQ